MKRSRKSENAEAALKPAEVAWLKKIGLKISELREQRGWSQDALATSIGVHRNTIINLENANKSTGIEILVKCLVAMDVDLWKFFGGAAKAAPAEPIELQIIIDQLKALIQLKSSTDPKKKNAADWISGNIETFHELYVRKR